MSQFSHQASKVHALIATYGLLRCLLVLNPLEGKKDHLLTFHSQEYVDFLEFLNDEDDSEKEQERKEEFGMSKFHQYILNTMFIWWEFQFSVVYHYLSYTILLFQMPKSRISG